MSIDNNRHKVNIKGKDKDLYYGYKDKDPLHQSGFSENLLLAHNIDTI